jgi:hypothetical protein
VVEHDYDVEMRVVVSEVLAAAANAVLVAQNLLKLGAHLTTALARLQVKNLAQRSSLEVGSTLDKKGAEELRDVRNSVWQFGTENKEMQRFLLDPLCNVASFEVNSEPRNGTRVSRPSARLYVGLIIRGPRWLSTNAL